MKTKIWEIDNRYFCPITGYCLSEEEQKLICKKFVSKEKQPYILKHLHQFLIATISNECSVSKYIKKILDKKYYVDINYFKNYTNEEWLKEAKNCLNYKDFGSFIWISATCKNLTKEENDQILTFIHEYSHKMFFELSDVQKANNNLNKHYGLLKNKYDKKTSKLIEIEAENRKLRTDNHKLKSNNEKLQKEIEANISKSNSHLEIPKEQFYNLEKEKNNLKTQNDILEKKIQKQKLILKQIEKDYEELWELLKNNEKHCENCENNVLCNKRVLVVGGITKLHDQYRKIVVELGGEFYYHDGYCRQNSSNLKNMINKADVIICPIDVNSHRACLQVKNNCKQVNKEYHMLRNSGISSMYKTLTNLKFD